MDILNPFPQLLDYRIFAPTLLRLAAATIFAYLAYRHYQQRNEIAKISFPVIGRGGWIVWFAIIIEAAIAGGLFLGLYTQAAAILGAVGALKQWVWRGKFPAFFWLTRSASFLLLVICLSLMVSGAGAFAFDIPL